MGDQVSEGVAVKTVGACCVEPTVRYAAAGVDCGEGVDVQLGCDCDIEGGEEFWGLVTYIIGVYGKLDAGIELLDLRKSCLCSLRGSE